MEWDMTLGSGAELRQIVKTDPIPGYWNWEASQFVNVQILNTVAFESVTGLAAPTTPISFQEYTKAAIPSLSYYPDAETSGAVVGRFPIVRTIGNIDSLLGIKYAVRLDPNGKPVGCVICERSICDSVYSPLLSRLTSRLTPCFHAFCNDCIRHRMSRGANGRRTTCVLCFTAISKVVVSSAPMETPVSSIAQKSMVTRAIESLSTDADVPDEIEQRLPSLAKLKPFFAFIGTGLTEEEFVSRFMAACRSDLECRLAIAQILKDIDFAHEPIPKYVMNAMTAVLLREPYFRRYGIREDLMPLLQSLVLTE
jgi:hypothetical protein